MANVRGGVMGERTRPRSYVVEEFVPLSTCAEVSDCHYLIFSLPGTLQRFLESGPVIAHPCFKKEDVWIQVQDSGDVTISGERRVNDKKYMYFEKKFKVPENCEVTKSIRELEGHVFYVIFPKKVMEKKRSKEGEKEKPGFSESNSNGRRRKEEKRGERREKVVMFFTDESVWKSAEKMVRQHKGLILTALVAISIVVLLSHRVKSPHFN